MADYMYFDGMPNDFFNILEDFPLEDIELGSEKDDWNEMQFDPMDMPLGFSTGLCGAIQNDFSKENKNLSPSYDKTCRPNQFASPAETTSSGGGGTLLSDDSSDAKPTHLFKTSSPVSILESSNSCFAENPKTGNPKIANPVKRARTKRSRPRPTSIDRLSTFFPFTWATTSSSDASDSSHPFANSESDSMTVKTGKAFKPAKRVMKKKRVVPNPSGLEMRELSSPAPQQTGDTKRCTHCEVTSTPQWREGPMGPKTLCNACGVRYRSGRLFPEYRPAASPTFIPAVHSNSHKKVIEMRNKASLGSDGSSTRAGVKLYFRSQAGNSVKQLIV